MEILVIFCKLSEINIGDKVYYITDMEDENEHI